VDYLSLMLPSSLPPDNYELLKALFMHIYRVVEKKDINKMNESNMATVWGPNLISASDPIGMQSATLPEVIKTLIRQAPKIFDQANRSRASEAYEAKAGYDLQPMSDNEIQLRAGDIVFVWRTFSADWVYAENNGSIGLVPLNYLVMHQG